MNDAADYLRHNFPLTSMNFTDEFSRNPMILIVTSYDATNLYGFYSIYDQFVLKMTSNSTDNIDRNDMVYA